MKGRQLMQNDRVTFGSIETVAVPSLGIAAVVAKVDTGAWTGALHCTDVYEKDGVLYLTPLGDPELATSTASYETRLVRGATGHAMKRYIIPVTLVVKGRPYETNLGLSDRQMLKREMLLGRKFLIENDILVDVTLTLNDDHEAEMYL